ncbi:MAG: helix-turn-helix transcriptional regulator [Phycisphaerae bacterium]|nr:helix-turn-helix transcriptional regulator [Phycisphaerae bacterium]
MSSSPSLFRWPTRTFPTIKVAGRFPLHRENFQAVYCAPTHAIHLYDYHGFIRIGEKQFELSPGVVTISPAGGETSYHMPRKGYHLCIHFHPVTATKDQIKIPTHLPPGPHSSLLSQRMCHIARLHQTTALPGRSGVIAKTAASTALQELLLYLAVISQPQPSKSQRTLRSSDAVDQTVRILSESLAEPLSVPQLAKQVGLSRDYLTKLFRQRHGLTIPRYLQTLRMDHAKQLLTETNLSIKQIGARVGYPDPQHFNKRFRQTENQSPSEFRSR